jgi:structural maintenance of chromosome 2
VYYYRFAPGNTDRSWDIGLVISIAEPAVHIMTACAPATKCLFRYLFPWFGRTVTPAYYDEHTSGQPIPHRSRHGSKSSRATLGGFKFNLPGLKRRSDVEEIDMTGRTPKFSIQKDDNVHTMKRVESVSSMGTRMESHVEEKSMEAEARRNSCTYTTTTSLGDTVEAIPKHCLGHPR